MDKFCEKFIVIPNLFTNLREKTVYIYLKVAHHVLWNFYDIRYSRQVPSLLFENFQPKSSSALNDDISHTKEMCSINRANREEKTVQQSLSWDYGFHTFIRHKCNRILSSEQFSSVESVLSQNQREKKLCLLLLQLPRPFENGRDISNSK